jgi:hypothetical protein
MHRSRRILRPLLLAALAVLAGLSFTIAITTDDDGQGHKHTTVTIKVDGIDPDRARDDTLTAPAAVVEDVEQEAKADVADASLDDGELPMPATSLEGGPLPQAAQSFDGCKTAFVRNMSSRYGVTPRVIVWHITAGPDRPGPSDNVALTGMANNPANGVSWHFSIGSKDGYCYYNVPLSMSAWTAAGANRFTVNIEVINHGSEPYFVTGPGRERLLQVTREISQRLDIPLQPAIVTDCRLVRAGIDQHKWLDDATTCAGGHNDADNSRPAAVAQVNQLIRELDQTPITKRDRRTCRKIHAYRNRKRHARKGHKRRQTTRRQFVKRRGHQCVRGKPRQRT